MSEECKEELVKEALNAIRGALMAYLKVSCKKSLSIIRLTGQKRLRIDFYGLFNYYDPTDNFPRFMDAYSYAVKCAGQEKVNEVLEGEVIGGSDTGYQISIPSEKYEKLCKQLGEA
jgi:hypothetical protein